MSAFSQLQMRERAKNQLAPSELPAGHVVVVAVTNAMQCKKKKEKMPLKLFCIISMICVPVLVLISVRRLWELQMCMTRFMCECMYLYVY